MDTIIFATFYPILSYPIPSCCNTFSFHYVRFATLKIKQRPGKQYSPKTTTTKKDILQERQKWLQGKTKAKISPDLLSTVTFITASATPPGFRASHLYCPSSLSVNCSRIKFVLFSSIKSISFLYQDTCGFGKLSLMMQVRFSLSPSRMVQFGLNNWTLGGTKENKGAQKI